MIKQQKFRRKIQSFDKVTNNQYDPTSAISDRSALSFGKVQMHMNNQKQTQAFNELNPE